LEECEPGFVLLRPGLLDELAVLYEDMMDKKISVAELGATMVGFEQSFWLLLTRG
jgi:hypothetical protein